MTEDRQKQHTCNTDKTLDTCRSTIDHPFPRESQQAHQPSNRNSRPQIIQDITTDTYTVAAPRELPSRWVQKPLALFCP
jgi:hypothetical protein